MPAPVSSATYDAANRILSFDGFTPTYDANGNLTELDGDTYAWNVRDELVSITGPNLSASFGYDAVGRRSTKTINGQTTHYLADGINPLQEQASAGGPWTALTMTGAGVDEIIARGDASGTYYFLPDGLGSTVALMDGTGAIHTEYTYAPFGDTTRTGTVSTNPFQFTGRENDNTGLYYYRARYYHPVLQRFMSEDPIGFGGGDVNLYGYVRNSPVNWSDPEGLSVIGSIVRLCRKGGLPKKVKPLHDLAEARKARRQGLDVQARNRQSAGAIERGAFPNEPHLRHPGHPLPDGSIGRPHYQTPGRYGHTFWGIVGIIGSLLDPFDIIAGEIAQDPPLEDYLPTEPLIGESCNASPSTCSE